jgi:hypothetical protein
MAAALVGMPGMAAAKKNKKKNRGAPPPVVQHVAHPGNGIGKGGVPALRDHLLALIAAVNGRVDRLVRHVHAIEMRVSDLEDGLGDADARLDLVEGRLDNLEAVVAGLVQQAADLASDDDGDGYSELQNDCDDTDPAVNPPATGLDLNCDGIVEVPIP